MAFIIHIQFTTMNKEYLIEYRLPEVIGLIQVLAFDLNTSRAESGLADDLGKEKPMSGGSWLEVASKHPEFFRLRSEEQAGRKDGKIRAALISRYVLEYEKLDSGEEKRPPLSTDQVSSLIDVAIQMHDKQVARSERWKTFVPLIGVIIVAIATIIAPLIKSIIDNAGN